MNGKALAAFAVTFFLFPPSGASRVVGARMFMRAADPSHVVPPQSGSVRPNEGARLFQAGRYLEAARFFRSRYDSAVARHDYAKAVSSLNNLAGCYFATFQYREAMRWYLEAKRLAQATGGSEHLPGLSANISSLYLQLGDVRAAQYAAEEGLGNLPAGAALH